MSILRLNDNPTPTPPVPVDEEIPARGMGLRYASLAVMGLCIFGISVVLLLRVVPPPFQSLDYMVIGTVSVMAALLVVFLVAAKTSFWKT